MILHIIFIDMTATNGMTKATHLKINIGAASRYCPVLAERSVHLSFRTFQDTGHPYPVL